MRGDGRVLRYPGSRYWHMAYWDPKEGKEVRESTRETDEHRARRVLSRRIAELLRGDAIPHEHRVTLADLSEMLRTDYEVNGRRSLATFEYPLRHLLDFFGANMKAAKITTDRIQKYVAQRRRDGAANATVNNELALLGRAFTLGVRAKRLRARPYIPRLAADPSRVRQGFFSRQQVEALCSELPADIADAVGFLFFSTWRVGEVRSLQWRDYDRTERTIRLRPEHSKNKHGRVLPVEGELADIMSRRLQKRRLDCPFIFHRNGRPIGDFRRPWKRACAAIGLAGRIVHDLRRSGVRHLINAGNDPHVVMEFSGHRTTSMLRRYHIINLDDLRAAATRGSVYREDATPGVSVLRRGTENS